MHAAAQQRADLAFRVQIIRDFLAVDLEAYGIESEVLTDIHRNEERHLRVRWKQQFFLEQEQVAVEIQHFLLESLYVLVELPEFALRLGRRGTAVHRRDILRRHGNTERQHGRREQAEHLLLDHHFTPAGPRTIIRAAAIGFR